jgi:hypothetical protein
MSRKYAGNTRGKPFNDGNPGKPKGARHKEPFLKLAITSAGLLNWKRGQTNEAGRLR